MLSSSDSDDLPGLVHVIASRMYPVFNAISAHYPQANYSGNGRGPPVTVLEFVRSRRLRVCIIARGLLFLTRA